MADFDWETILKRFSRRAIANYQSSYLWQLTPAMRQSEWLGYPGATDSQILEAEARLGIQFPPSYRSFLKVSNGWQCSDWTELELWSTVTVDWFAVRNQAWIDDWMIGASLAPPVTDEQYFMYGVEQDPIYLRSNYLQTALEVSSSSGDGDIFLLIPEVVFEHGEWEAWHFGTKLPGAYRYQSFYDLMQAVAERGYFIS